MKLLKKEFILCMHPTAYIMLLMSAFVLIPGYPYTVSCFYMGLAIYFICLTASCAAFWKWRSLSSWDL